MGLWEHANVRKSNQIPTSGWSTATVVLRYPFYVSRIDPNRLAMNLKKFKYALKQPKCVWNFNYRYSKGLRAHSTTVGNPISIKQQQLLKN